MRLTKEVNVFNQEKRKIRCIANKHDYLGDGSEIFEEELEVGKEYTFLRGESSAIGMTVHLEEVNPGHKFGYQSYLFEEMGFYDKEILKKAYTDWLAKELEKSEESIRNGDYYTHKEIMRFLEGKYDNRRKKKRRMIRLKRKHKKQNT